MTSAVFVPLHFSYVQAIFTGLIQGVTELFPVSSLGHAVLMPAWVGGSWRVFASSDRYFLVTIALHLASAIALFLVFWKRWLRLLAAFIQGLIRRDFTKTGFRVLWLILVATVPVALLGYLFGDYFQTLFGKPVAAASFLLLNGFILIGAERLSRSHGTYVDPDVAIAERVSVGQAFVVGVGQSAALFAGISRFGITMSFGLLRGLSRSVASDFAFLLAFPVILGASITKLPKLASSDLHGMVGPIIVAAVVAFIGTFVAIKFLVKWFKTNTLYPFAIYCLIIGGASLLKFGLFN
ncbi:MAG: undecaprenyl-diphosphate phosphatase [Actinomycetes bacterium]